MVKKVNYFPLLGISAAKLQLFLDLCNYFFKKNTFLVKKNAFSAFWRTFCVNNSKKSSNFVLEIANTIKD